MSFSEFPISYKKMGNDKKKDLETRLVDSLLDRDEFVNESESSKKNQDEDWDGTAILESYIDGQEAESSFQSSATESGDADENTQFVTGVRSSSKEKSSLYETKVGFGLSSKQNEKSSLAQAENLKIAQRRILELESETERLREQNEELIAAGETLRRRSDELLAKSQKFKRQYEESKDLFEDEKKILIDNTQFKDQEIDRFKMKIEELELRLAGDLKKIRVRERELENRLELLRMEGQAVVKNKDEFILQLNRELDKKKSEADTYREKCQELYRQIEADQERQRRTVKALRLALSNLETGTTDANVLSMKKAQNS